MPRTADAPAPNRQSIKRRHHPDAVPNTRRSPATAAANRGNHDLLLARLSGEKRPDGVPEPDMGFTVRSEGSRFVVSSVRPDSAASRAGIAVGQQVKLYKLFPYGVWEGEQQVVSHRLYSKWDEHALDALNDHPADTAIAVRVNSPNGLPREAAVRFNEMNRLKHLTSSLTGLARQARLDREVVAYDVRALKRSRLAGPADPAARPSAGPSARTPADRDDGDETMSDADEAEEADGEEGGEDEGDDPSDRPEARANSSNHLPPSASPRASPLSPPSPPPRPAAEVTFSSRPGIVAEFYQVGEEPTVAHLSRGASSVLTSEKAELTPELVFFLCAKMAQLVPAARLRVLHPSFYELSVLKQDVSAWRDFLVADPPTVCLPVFDHKLKRWVLVVIYFPDSDPDSDKLAVVFYVDSGSRFGYVDVVGKKVDQFLQCAYRQVADPNGVIGRRVVLSSSLPPLGPDATATATAAVSGVRVVSHVATVVRLLQSEPEALAERLGRAMLDFVLTKKHLLAELWDAQDAALQEPAWWGRLEAVESADQPGWWPCRRLVLTPNTASPGEEGGDATVAVVWLGREDSGVQWLPPTSLKALGEMAVDEALESLEADREELERSFNRAVKLNSGVVGG